MFDLSEGLSPAQSLTPAARTATATGAAVDIRGYFATLVVISVGLWTDGAHTFTVQDSDDGVTFANVAAAQLKINGADRGGAASITVDANDEDNTVHSIGYLGHKDYLRVVQTVAGGPATGLVAGADVVRGRNRHVGGQAV